jgi:Family of unknown function (DUF6069)
MTTPVATTESTSTTNSATARRWPGRLATIAVAAGLSLLVWVILDPVAGIDLAARSGDQLQSIGPASVLTGVLVSGAMGWGLLAILERFTRRPQQIWTISAGIALVLSLGGPLGSGDGVAGKLALTGFHLLVAAVLVPGFRRTVR